ncbi:hypothetical protein [Micromonospora haikouensis]|uniref:hypothetical protein n=1 Tax=Micromonospora haikouensis TaxID=686309 RepID=UPI003D711ED9
MAEIRTIRTARKQHTCEADTGTRCRTTIEPGDRYLLASLPPNSEMGNPDWWRMKICRGCAEQYGQTLDEQATPRRRPARRRRRPVHAQTTYRGRRIVDVHLPAHDIA